MKRQWICFSGDLLFKGRCLRRLNACNGLLNTQMHFHLMKSIPKRVNKSLTFRVRFSAHSHLDATNVYRCYQWNFLMSESSALCHSLVCSWWCPWSTHMKPSDSMKGNADTDRFCCFMGWSRAQQNNWKSTVYMNCVNSGKVAIQPLLQEVK